MSFWGPLCDWWKNLENFWSLFWQIGHEKGLKKYSILDIFLFDFSVFFGCSFSPKTEKDLKTEKTEKTFSVGTIRVMRENISRESRSLKFLASREILHARNREILAFFHAFLWKKPFDFPSAILQFVWNRWAICTLAWCTYYSCTVQL